MKRTSLMLLSAALAVLVLAAFTLRPAPTSPEGIDIGDAAPMTDIEMMDVSGEMMTLADAAGENGLLVLFSCNTCPYVLAWEDRYPDIAAQAEDLGLGMIALNSNTTQHDGVDSIAQMKKRAEEQGYSFPYVVDKNNVLADAFGATRTPEAFLFDSDMILQYHGAIDDNAQNADQVEHSYLLDAMNAMVAGETIDMTTTKSVGCTIKRV